MAGEIRRLGVRALAVEADLVDGAALEGLGGSVRKSGGRVRVTAQLNLVGFPVREVPPSRGQLGMGFQISFASPTGPGSHGLSPPRLAAIPKFATLASG